MPGAERDFLDLIPIDRLGIEIDKRRNRFQQKVVGAEDQKDSAHLGGEFPFGFFSCGNDSRHIQNQSYSGARDCPIVRHGLRAIYDDLYGIVRLTFDAIYCINNFIYDAIYGIINP